jgi:hypothetical protein
MLPSIALVFSVEMIRDGGSLAATFQGTDGCEYWLFLQVRIGDGFEEPVILDRLTQRKIPITWQQAESLLNQVHPHLSKDRDLYWFSVMKEAVEAKGVR